MAGMVAGTRVGAALRQHADPEPFVLGDLAIDYGRRRVSVAGRKVDLTPTEFGHLRAISFNAGRLTTYEAVVDQESGAAAATAAGRSCAPSSSSSAPSSGTTPQALPGSSTCAVQATASSPAGRGPRSLIRRCQGGWCGQTAREAVFR